MRATGSRAYARSIPVPKMPSGLVELMEDLSKEVLRNNPENIFEFCAAHMLKLLEIRDGNSFGKIMVKPLHRKILLVQENLQQKDYDGIKIHNLITEHSQNLPNETLSNSDMCVSSTDNKNECIKIDNHLLPPFHQEIILSGNDEIEISHESISDIMNDKTCNKLETKFEDVIVQSNEKDSTEINIFESKKLADKIEIQNDLDTNIHHSASAPIFEIEGQDVANKITPSVDTNVPSTNNFVIELTQDNDNHLTTPETLSDNTIQHEKASFKKGDEEIKNSDENSEEILNNDIENIIRDTPIIEQVMEGNPEIHESVTICDDISTEGADVIETERKIINESSCLTENDNPSCTPTLENSLVLESSTTPFNTVIKDSQALENLSETDLKQQIEATEFSTSSSKMKTISKSLSKEVAESVTSPGNDTTNDENNRDSHSCVESNKQSNSNMDLETAAITIQKVFRSFLFKSRASTCDSNDENNSIDEDSEKKELSDFSNMNLVKDRRVLGLTRMDTVLQTVNEEKSLSLSTDDSSTLSSAATVIQAHVRGFLVRNKFKSNNTISTCSVPNFDLSPTSRKKAEVQKSKTVLNIHIVPDGTVSNLSRDESFLTSMELSLDGSPPSSVNLHPLGYNKSEPRKQLKREDAIQSVSPPSNNSGKLSEDVDSVKEILINDSEINKPSGEYNIQDSKTSETTLVENIAVDPVLENKENDEKDNFAITKKTKLLRKMTSDEMDVVTAFTNNDKKDDTKSLVNSGELHDIVLPTNVLRSDSTVVRGE